MLARAPRRFVAESDAAWLAADLAGHPLVVRSPRPGDRYRSLGAPGSKPLSRCFVDRKVARPARSSAVVLQAGDRIAWVQGLPVGEWARVPRGAEWALRVTILAAAPRKVEPEGARGLGA
jgi:tRNA(Ile)-lysidine synthase